MEHSFSQDILKDKRVIITGGASGLGFEMAKAFLLFGANVAICGRNQEKLDAAKNILLTVSPNVFVKTCDVRQSQEVSDFFDAVQTHWGNTANVLVNNAAGNFLALSESLSDNAFSTVVDIVLKGTFHCSREFANRLIPESKPGSILNIVTTYAESGSAFVLPSACAKAGVLAMTRSLAYEWAEYGIRINAIAPGPFPTQGAWSRLMPHPDFEKKYMEKNPTKRVGQMSELTNTAIFIISDLANYMNGNTITLDGAESLSSGQFNFLASAIPRPQLKQVLTHLKQGKREN